ncbi:hypothetical protein CR513_10683, partial [Mucuna pruriens]
MTARTKIDVHARTLSMEFGDTLDYSLFGIDLIDELVEDCLQLHNSSGDSENFAGSIDSIGCLGSTTAEIDYVEVHDLLDSEEDNIDLADLSQEVELIKLLDHVHNHENSECSNKAEVQVVETKKLPLPSYLKYAYLDTKKQFPVIIANNLHQEQEDKLLQVLRQHKKAIGWKLSDLPRINPAIYMHRILMEEEAKPIRQ